MSVEQPPVSIIMPCYNSADTLQAALDGALALEYPEYEVVVVDDCSTDGSFGILQSYAARSPLVRIFRLDRNSGVQVARDFASRQARYGWIASTDSDAVVPPGWLRAAALRFGDADLLGGRFLAEPRSYIEKCLNLTSLHREVPCAVFTSASTKMDPYAGGANLFYKISAYHTIGGYDLDVRAAEDLLLVASGIEKGLTYILDPALYVHHPYTPQSRTFKAFVDRSWQTHKWRKVAGKKSRLIRNRNRLMACAALSVCIAFAGAVSLLGVVSGTYCFALVLAGLLLLQASWLARNKERPFLLCLAGACLKFVRRVVGGMAIILPGDPTISGWSKRF